MRAFQLLCLSLVVVASVSGEEAGTAGTEITKDKGAPGTDITKDKDAAGTETTKPIEPVADGKRPVDTTKPTEPVADGKTTRPVDTTKPTALPSASTPTKSKSECVRMRPSRE